MGSPGRLVLDASVLVEYVIKGSPYRGKLEALFAEARRGARELYASAVSLAEVLYVVSRVYEAAGVRDPNGEALNYLLWLRGVVEVVPVDDGIAAEAGELRKRLRIALPDCLVIATAMKIGGVPLFRSVEREMRPALDELRRLGVVFLDELPLG